MAKEPKPSIKKLLGNLERLTGQARQYFVQEQWLELLKVYSATLNTQYELIRLRQSHQVKFTDADALRYAQICRALRGLDRKIWQKGLYLRVMAPGRRIRNAKRAPRSKK